MNSTMIVSSLSNPKTPVMEPNCPKGRGFHGDKILEYVYEADIVCPVGDDDKILLCKEELIYALAGYVHPADYDIWDSAYCVLAAPAQFCSQEYKPDTMILGIRARILALPKRYATKRMLEWLLNLPQSESIPQPPIPA